MVEVLGGFYEEETGLSICERGPFGEESEVCLGLRVVEERRWLERRLDRQARP